MLYLNAINGVGIILILLIIYLLIKKRESGTKQLKVEDIEKDYKNLKTKSEKFEQPEEPEQVNIKDKQKKFKQKKIRQIPSHGKISKDDFKEFKGTKILIAEDNLINQKVIGSIFDGSQIDIDIVDNGQEVIDTIEKNNFYKIILMDVNMPIMDGLEATKIIRTNDKYDDIAIVALSGDIASDDIKKMLQAGMDDHLAKPINLNALYDVIYKYTDNHSIESNFLDIDGSTIQILDTKKGLELCMDDENFYKEILKEFIKNYEDSAQKLKELLDDKNIIHADRKLLDIVGITANIGAKNLHITTKKLKKSIVNSEKEDYMLILQKYEKQLNELIKEIKNYNP